MLKRFLIIAIIFLAILQSNICSAQKDTFKILSYNTLNYDIISIDCPDNLNSKKNHYLREILKYENPDIIGLVKMNSSQVFVNDSIPAFVLDSVCKGCWDHGIYSTHSGYGKANMLYFKKAKFGLIDTKTIYSGDAQISDINMHQLYYKDTALARTHDTIFLNIILVHDLSGGSNAAARTTEISGAMAWLDANIKHPGNYIFMGDFNVTSSSEGCFQAMINPANKMIKFNEPTGQLGNWSSSPASFAKYLTVDTRTAALPDCGANSGMKGWFDHILCSDFIVNGTDAFTYVPASFKVTGQDGNHTNKAIIDAPSNTVVPANILNDVYHMSNHMPICLNLALNTQHRYKYSGIEEAAVKKTGQGLNIAYYHNTLNIQVKNNDLIGKTSSVIIYDCLGNEVFKKQIVLQGPYMTIDSPLLKDGIYIVAVQAEGQNIAVNKIVKLQE